MVKNIPRKDLKIFFREENKVKVRARDLGITFDGICGENNAITDVDGVEVGYTTIIRGEASADTVPEDDFARTGVTAILPRGKRRSAVFAGRHDLNGNGELTGTHWIDDSGFLHGPIMITNTHSVGVVREAASKWMIKNGYFYPLIKEGEEIPGLAFFYPVVGETFDGVLNNINGFKIKEEHAVEALENAHTGPIAEGNVGGGTGMRCHGFKGGTGTASRVINDIDGREYKVGVLVQANHGTKEELRITGIPFGEEIKGYVAELPGFAPKPGDGSIIVIIATDAPMMPWQLSKLCKRVPLGIGNLGGGCQNGSGDIFLAFSTANENAFSKDTVKVDMLSDEQIDPFYKAVVQAVEEAILNAMISAETMTGRNLNKFYAIPHDQIKNILKKYEILFHK